MEISSDSSPAKRSRAKLKLAKTPVEALPVVAKKPRAARKTPTATTEVTVVAATVEPTAKDVGSMIATAAYYLAAARNFSPGHELDDWLAAERAVHAQLYG